MKHSPRIPSRRGLAATGLLALALLGSGIAPGKKVKLIWNASTNNQDCKQYVKAVFADGSEVKTAKMDFCDDLDEPIVFSD